VSIAANSDFFAPKQINISFSTLQWLLGNINIDEGGKSLQDISDLQKQFPQVLLVQVLLISHPFKKGNNPKY